MIGAIVETKELLETVLYASVSGIGLTLIVSLGIYGSTRFADFSRDGRTLEAAAAGALAVLALLATLTMVVVGIIVMTQK